MARGVQRRSVAGQLRDVVVDRMGKILVGDADLGIEDQVMADAPKLLEVGGDGYGVRFVLMPLHPFFLAGSRGGAVFGFGHAATKAFSRGRRKLSIRNSGERRRATGGRGCGKVGRQRRIKSIRPPSLSDRRDHAAL
jgi:hypothetical protein